MLIFIDFTPYLWLDGTKMQQKPQTLQGKIDQWLLHIATSLSFSSCHHLIIIIAFKSPFPNPKTHISLKTCQ